QDDYPSEYGERDAQSEGQHQGHVCRRPPGSLAGDHHVCRRTHENAKRFGNCGTVFQHTQLLIVLDRTDSSDAKAASVLPCVAAWRRQRFGKHRGEEEVTGSQQKRGIWGGKIATNELAVDLDEFRFLTALHHLVRGRGIGVSRFSIVPPLENG